MLMQDLLSLLLVFVWGSLSKSSWWFFCI